MTRPTLLIAEDHRVVADGLRSTLEYQLVEALDVKSSAELIHFAIRNGIAEP